MEEIFELQIAERATVLRPGTVLWYRQSIRLFLNYLHTTHPEVTRLSQLRRDPHILGWLRNLYERQPRLANHRVRSLFNAARASATCGSFEGGFSK
jgi:hypothetical protein